MVATFCQINWQRYVATLKLRFKVLAYLQVAIQVSATYFLNEYRAERYIQFLQRNWIGGC